MEKTFKLTRHVSIDTNEFQGMEVPGRMQELMRDKIVMSSLEKIPFLDFGVSELTDITVEKATLTLYCDTEDFPVEVYVSTVTTDWDADSRIFRPDGSVITDSIMGLNGSVFSKQKAVFSEWTNSLTIEIPPEFVRAMASGESKGLAVLDYKSKAFLMTDEGWLIHKSFYALSDESRVPELSVKAASTGMPPVAGDEVPCNPEKNTSLPSVKDCAPCETRTPAPIALPDLPQHSCAVANGHNFSVFVLDEFTKINPITGNAYDSGELHINNLQTPVIGDNGIRFRGVKGEKLAFQLVVCNETDAPQDIAVSFKDMDCFTANKVWYLQVDGEWHPEVAIPMKNDDTFAIPYAENNIPGQRYQSVFVDIYLPEPPGEFTCSVQLTCGDESVSFPVNITIHDIALPRADFVFDLTGYSSPPNFMNSYYGDADYFEIEDGYHRVAYNHNGQVNVIPYSQNGTVRDGFAPRAIFENGVLTGLDWTEWDNHFKRLLDGSYMEKTAGKRIPISHMCIPVHENWPCNIDEYYNVPVSTNRYPEMVNENRLLCRSLEEDFKPGYWESIKNCLVEFIRHTDEKGWQHVDFIWYVNNKHYWKNRKTMIENNMYVGGTSWWLLDEPLLMSDWEAVAMFGKQLRAAKAETGSGKNFKFRIDTSYYCCQFTYMDGLCDINCLNTPSFKHMAGYSLERRQEFNEEMWNYGQLPPINSSPTQIPLHLIHVFLSGGTGYLPWQNYGDDQNFEVPSVVATLYPGHRFKLKEPVPSLRFKAVRKGMEILNYLAAFKAKHGYDEMQMLQVIGSVLPLESKANVAYFEDAGTTEYRGATFADFERLKEFILDELKSF